MFWAIKICVANTLTVAVLFYGVATKILPKVNVFQTVRILCTSTVNRSCRNAQDRDLDLSRNWTTTFPYGERAQKGEMSKSVTTLGFDTTPSKT
jgi:hypothetical protein